MTRIAVRLRNKWEVLGSLLRPEIDDGDKSLGWLLYAAQIRPVIKFCCACCVCKILRGAFPFRGAPRFYVLKYVSNDAVGR